MNYLKHLRRQLEKGSMNRKEVRANRKKFLKYKNQKNSYLFPILNT